MKKSVLLIFIVHLILLVNMAMSQTRMESKTPVSFQFGTSGGFFPGSSQPVLIPQIGLDARLGVVGFRVSGQYFKTSPDFNLDGYLIPVKSEITITDRKKTNSNVVVGLEPYFNIGKKFVSIQPGVALNYLMQKGATANVVYYQTPATPILTYPEGDSKHNLLMVEPNFRVSLGHPGNLLRVYVQAGYTIPLGSKEYSYTYRKLTNVIDAAGKVDIKALQSASVINTTETVIPSFASAGVGIEFRVGDGLYPRKRPGRIKYSTFPVDNGIRESGLKKTESTSLTNTSLEDIGDGDEIKSNGEPVTGFEIYIEQEPNDEPIANVVTGANGEFEFGFPEGHQFPESGKFTFTITPPKSDEGNLKNQNSGEFHPRKRPGRTSKMATTKQKIAVNFTVEKGKLYVRSTSPGDPPHSITTAMLEDVAKKGVMLKFILIWKEPRAGKGISKGGFAIRDRSGS